MPVAQPGILYGPESSATVWLAPAVKPGASLTGLAVTFTITIISEHSLGLPLSQAVYSKLAWPLTAWSTAVTVRVWLLSLVGPGSSLRRSWLAAKTRGVSSLVDMVSALATGASFTALTAMLTVAGSLSAVPSEASKVKLSGPLLSSAGV